MGSFVLWAQGPPPGVGNPNNPTGNAGRGEQSQAGITFDTSTIHYYYPNAPEQLIPYSDSLLWRFHQYDPARTDWERPGLHLGNLGTASLPVRFALPDEVGFDLGFNAYEPYYSTWQELPFIVSNQAYTNFKYSQGQQNTNSQIQAAFGRQVGENLRFSLDYKRINNDGYFRFQQAQTTAFNVGFHYQHPSRRYENFIIYSINNAEQEEPGGYLIPNPEQLSSIFRVPLLLSGAATTRHAERAYVFKQRLALRKGAKNALNIHHQLEYNRRQYRFSDPALTETTADYYGGLLTDSRGVRYFARHYTLENRFALAWERLEQDTTFADRPSGVRAGLSHRFQNVQFEPRDSQFQEVLLTGNLELPLSPSLHLSGNGAFAILGNIGNYQLNGRLRWRLPKWGSVTAMVKNQLRNVDFTAHEFYLTQRRVWQNDFEPVFSTRIGGRLDLDRFNVSLAVNSYVIQNYQYWNADFQPQQAGGATAILSTRLAHRLQFWKLNFENSIIWQEAPDYVTQPRLYSDHALYFESYAFEKKLLVQLGIDVRTLAPDDFVTFQPAIGQFVLSENNRSRWVFPADIYASIKVKRTRLFLKWENINPNFIEYADSFLENYYLPYGFSTLRWGASWRFVE